MGKKKAGPTSPVADGHGAAAGTMYTNDEEAPAMLRSLSTLQPLSCQQPAEENPSVITVFPQSAPRAADQAFGRSLSEV